MYVYVCMDLWLYMFVYICMWMCVCLFVFFIIYMYKKKCVLKIIHKVVNHQMYIIGILVCGTYDNFQDKNHLDRGFVWIFVCIFVFLCEGLCVFFVCRCECKCLCCFVWVFHVNIMFVCLFIYQYNLNMNFKLKFIVIV